MTEEDVARLFRRASSLGYNYEIALLGDDCIVAAPGYENGDYRISDSEHIIHELSHCVLLGVSFGGSPSELIGKRLAATLDALPRQEQCMNEIEVFSVVMEVMRRHNIEFDENDYLVQLPIQLDNFVKPEGFDTDEHVHTFHSTERGRAAVETIMQMMEAASVTKEELKKKIEEALVPCAACCLDDDKDRKRVIDHLVRAILPLVKEAP